MKAILLFACLSAVVAYTYAVACRTTDWCRENNHAHMSCANGQVACIHNVCTCYTPSGGTSSSSVDCTANGRSDCLASNMITCSDARRHCVDGKCVCTQQ